MHIISRKYSSLLEALYGVTDSEKLTSKIVNEIYTLKNVFKPTTYYLGNYIIKNHHVFILLDTNGTYLITLKENQDTYEVFDLHAIIDYTISYISVKEEINIVGEKGYDTITLEINENKIEFIWK